MRKRLFLLTLIAISLSTKVSAYDALIDGIAYNLDNSLRSASVADYNSWYRGDIIVPPTVEWEGVTYSVYTVSEEAFMHCESLTSVTLPNSVSTIGQRAFAHCPRLKTVNIPPSVTRIEASTFSGCYSLESIVLPDGISYIGASAFRECSNLKSINLHDNIYNIGQYAFFGCSSLGSVNIPKNLSIIDYGTFSYCSSLTSIEIPSTVTILRDWAFSDCSGLESLTIPSSVNSINQNTFAGCGSLMSIVVEPGNTRYDSRNNCNAIIETSRNYLIRGCNTTIIPEGITFIDNSAFEGCNRLESISIPNSVTGIENDAFRNCTALKSLFISKSVRFIDSFAFSGCTNLESITVDPDNPNFDSRNNCNAIIDTYYNMLILGCKNTQIPNDVTSIGAYSFVGTKRTIDIPNSVETIGSSAFSYCDQLTYIVFPEGTKTIDSYCLEFCMNLQSITIPSTVDSIGWGIIQGCENICDVYCNATEIPKTNSEAFDGIDFESITLHVPSGCKSLYANTAPWSSFGTIIEEGELIEPFPDCTSGQVRQAALYLYNLGIVEGENGLLLPSRKISRSEVAKTSIFGLYRGPSNVPSIFPSDNYPCVYFDLQDPSTYYYRAAKALLYLEYGDGITPFDRNRLAFEPEGQIARDHVLKVLMETFNIQPDLTSTDNPFPNDANVVQLASTQPRLMGYIRKAAQLGIISTTNDEFRPYAYCTRGEAFVMLYRIMKKIESGEIENPDPQDDDYFQPLNTTLKTIALGTGLELGNFQHYTKTSFAMDGVMPLTFSHSYNSYDTNLPTVFYGDKSSTDQDESYKPMGDGWSHTYHSFITVVGNLTDGSARAIVHWGGGQIDVYKSENGELVPESMGVYDDCELDGTDVVITSKSQIKYRFAKQEDSESAILHLTSITDRNGNTLTVNYENGASNTKRISSVSDGHRSLSFSYLQGTDLLAEVQAPENRTISFTYFDNPQTFKKQLQSFTDAEGNTTTYEYNNLSNPAVSKLLTKIQLPKGNYIENEYDANRRLTKTTNGLNGVPTAQTTVAVTAEYGNQAAQMTSQVDVLRNGQTSAFNYTFDTNNVVTTITGAEDYSYSNTYGDDSHPELPTYIKDNELEIENICYDEKGNVTSFTLKDYSDNPTTHMTYDEMNNLTSITDPNGNTTTYTYDSNGNLTHISAPEEVTTDITVDSRGLPTEVTNALGIKTRFEYDDYGNLTKTLMPALNLVNSARYDDASRLISTTDELNRTKSFEYNKNDFLTKETDAANHATRYEYDANDNLKKITNAKNGVTTLSYDEATDWLTSVSFGGNTRHYAYNPDGTIKSLTKPDGTTYNYTYDGLGRVTDDGIYQYEYYYDRPLLQRITKDSKKREFGFDALRRLTDSHSTGDYDDFVFYNYDANGNCNGITYKEGSAIYTYDGQNRMTEIEYYDYLQSMQSPLARFSYRKDNQIEQAQYGYKNVIYVDYSYDEAGRLIGKKTYMENGTVIANYTLELDDAGNIVRQNAFEPFGRKVLSDEEVSYSYNNSNRITRAGNISFEFDANGNTTKRGSETYTWDASDRLVNAGGTEITYDPTGLIASYGDTNFAVDPLGMGNVISDSKSGARYIYGDGLEARVVNGVFSFYVTDLRGSVVAIVDENGNITHKYQYDEFGNVLRKEEADYNPFQYVGKYGVMYLSDHLYYMRARHYDPTIGRFLSEDPIWSTNLYPYADNNPVMEIDPEGLWGKNKNTYCQEQYDELIKQMNKSADLSETGKMYKTNKDGSIKTDKNGNVKYTRKYKNTQEDINEALDNLEEYCINQNRLAGHTGTYTKYKGVYFNNEEIKSIRDGNTFILTTYGLRTTF